MKKTVDNIPFLRITAALSAGILLGTFLKAGILIIFCLLVVITAIVLWVNAHYGYKRATVFGVAVHLFFIATGIILYNTYNKTPDFFSNGKFVATVQEILLEKENSYQSVIKVRSVTFNDSTVTTAENVLTYFEKNSKSKALLPGHTLVFQSSPREIINNGYPFEFDYKNYMARRKIYRQVYLSSDEWLLADTTGTTGISLLAGKVRMKLLNIYNQQKWNDRQVNVLSALTLGYKQGLSPEIKKTFASAGAMHILAVSGLHTGIVYLVINFLAGFLKRRKYGRFLFVILSVTVLWSFAFITGLSPSVMRAATMFTFVILGRSFRRQPNIYNTLATSAFFLLLLNPNNLFDVGFQLSYSAVFGIVFLQPKLDKLISFRFELFNYFRSLLTISVAAQIATLPIALYYFHQFPVYFWLSNLFIIPAVTLLIPMGMGLLIFSSVPFIAVLLAKSTGWMLNLLLVFLEWIEKLPFAVVPFYLSGKELLFVLLSLMSLFFFIELKKPVYFKNLLLFILLFTGSSLIRKTIGLYQKEIIQYNYLGHNMLHLISGKKNYVVTEGVLEDNDYRNELIQNTVQALNLAGPVYLTSHSSFNDSVLYLKDGLIFFEGKAVLFDSGSRYEFSSFISGMNTNHIGFKRKQLHKLFVKEF